jgi:hypothetical protein
LNFLFSFDNISSFSDWIYLLLKTLFYF